MAKNNYWRNKYPASRVYVSTPTGSKYFEEEGWTYRDAKLTWEKKGKTNVYEQIQAERESCDIKMILDRLQPIDDTVLNKVEAMYLDTVDMPTSYRDMFDKASKLVEIYEALPVELREHYNHDPGQFVANYGTQEMADAMNAYKESVFDRVSKPNDNPVVATVEESEVVE